MAARGRTASRPFPRHPRHSLSVLPHPPSPHCRRPRRHVTWGRRVAAGGACGSKPTGHLWGGAASRVHLRDGSPWDAISTLTGCGDRPFGRGGDTEGPWRPGKRGRPERLVRLYPNGTTRLQSPRRQRAVCARRRRRDDVARPGRAAGRSACVHAGHADRRSACAAAAAARAASAGAGERLTMCARTRPSTASPALWAPMPFPRVCWRPRLPRGGCAFCR